MANARALIIVYVFIFVFTKSSYSLTTTIPPPQQESFTCDADAAANSAPFIVMLEQNGKPVCAGSILSENWVVMAAHCLTSSQSDVVDSTLVAGSTLVGGNASTTQKRSINYYVVHDSYSRSSYGNKSNDIGLIYTATPFTWSSNVAAINLPTSDGTTPSGNAISYGWDRHNPEYTLQVVTVPIISLDTCKSQVEELTHHFKIYSTHICTTFTETTGGGDGKCKTDCSGPLIQQTNNQNVLIGIASFGPSICNFVDVPSIYVLVSSQIEWINANKVVPSTSELFNV